MAKRKVEIEVSTDTEIALMGRYGRKRELKTLVMNAIDEALSLTAPYAEPPRKKREKKDEPTNAQGSLVASNTDELWQPEQLPQGNIADA